MRISDWSSDVCSSDLQNGGALGLDQFVGGFQGVYLRGIKLHAAVAAVFRLHTHATQQPKRGADVVQVGYILQRDGIGWKQAGAQNRQRCVFGARYGNFAVQAIAANDLEFIHSGSPCIRRASGRSEEHTSELQSLMRISYAVFCLKKKKKHKQQISALCEHEEIKRN